MYPFTTLHLGSFVTDKNETWLYIHKNENYSHKDTHDNIQTQNRSISNSGLSHVYGKTDLKTPSFCIIHEDNLYPMHKHFSR